MSGLGVAPLCLETIQGCKWLLSKVRTYRRFSREFGKLRTRLEVQMELFRDESEFVLGGTSTEPTITALLDGGDTEGTNMDELEDRLQDRLSGKYTSYRALFEEIYNTTTALKGEFQKLDASYSEMVGLHKENVSFSRLKTKRKLP
jgi:DNA repair ATPase RecN